MNVLLKTLNPFIFFANVLLFAREINTQSKTFKETPYEFKNEISYF